MTTKTTEFGAEGLEPLERIDRLERALADAFKYVELHQFVQRSGIPMPEVLARKGWRSPG